VSGDFFASLREFFYFTQRRKEQRTEPACLAPIGVEMRSIHEYS
jgi:hypothetical protein